MERKIIKEGTSVVCPFCGQAHLLTKDVCILTEVQERNLGALGCNCGASLRYRTKEDNKGRVPALLTTLTKFCDRKGVKVKMDAVSAINILADAVIEEGIDSSSIKISSITVRLKLNKDGKLSMSVTHKDNYEQIT